MAIVKLAEEKKLKQIRCKEYRIIHGERKLCNQLLAETYSNFAPNSVVLFCKKCNKKTTF